jgi:signal transduction histidine kinase
MLVSARQRAATGRPGPDRAGGASDGALVAGAVAGAALTAGAIAVVVAGAPPDQRALAATAQALGVGLPIAVGLLEWTRRRDDRFARLLIAAGAGWSLTALASTRGALPYSAGRLAGWLVELAVIYLLLAFPSGRLSGRADRALVLAGALVFALLYLPTALLAQAYPTPAPWATCGVHCPPNAFALSDAEPALLGLVAPLRQILTLLVLAGVVAVLTRRMRHAGPLRRRALAPVLGVAVVHAAAITAYFPARASHPALPAVNALGWIYVFTLPLLALCFAAGLLGSRLFVARALERLALGLRRDTHPPELRRALAAALEDPGLRVLSRRPGEPARWVDEEGWPVAAPAATPGRAVAEVAAGGPPNAAIVHHPELAEDPALVRAAAAYALVALENDRLAHDLDASLRELSDSRTRMLSAADRERRRIERDLHDGAQQRLVALQINLALLRDRIAPRESEALRALEREVGAASAEMRALAHGIYPPLLTERGLAEALRAAARLAPLPTTVAAGDVRRYGPEVERTVYFACMEALQNAAKHANGATGVTITVSERDRLRFEVRDDGAGFAPGRGGGAGLANLRERLASVGGVLDVASVPGGGTCVAGAIPLR